MKDSGQIRTSGTIRKPDGRQTRSIRQIGTMMKVIPKPEVVGTRNGYIIHFTCPDCQKENSITYNMPRKFFQETRDAPCARCKKQFTILTPDHHIRKPVLSGNPAIPAL